jgi:hypothetical protein
MFGNLAKSRAARLAERPRTAQREGTAITLRELVSVAGAPLWAEQITLRTGQPPFDASDSLVPIVSARGVVAGWWEGKSAIGRVESASDGGISHEQVRCARNGAPTAEAAIVRRR